MACMRPILVTCLLLVLSEVAALGKTVRVFAVGSKLEIRYADTYQDFHDKMFALFDARHPRRAELVQAGADDVASHIQPVDPAAPDVVLVNFPEDIGLAVGLIGSRGAGARRFTASHGGSQLAFANLMLKYQPQSVYYASLYPGLPSVRYLLLAETDTFYRGFYETFRDLARAYGVYLTATVNVAPARRVESAQNPALVALLRDPDEAQGRDYAYVALSPNVFNTTFIFDPDGNVLLAAPDGHVMRSPVDTGGVLRGSLNKAYLTEAEESILPISFGKVQDLDVIETPAGRLGVVISKDAWMIDVNDRYDAKGAHLIIQPEAYSEWAYVADPWQPDGFKAGGFAQVQRNPSFLHNVAPCMTGNLYEITFDGQSAIIGKRRKGLPSAGQGAWIGQNPDTGFLRIAPWIIDDPGFGNPLLSLAQRRAELADAGAYLLPGSLPACASPTMSGACENGYRESVIHADVELPDGADVVVPADTGPRVQTAFGPNLQVTAGDRSAHQYARIAAHAGRVYVVWQDRRYGYENVFLAVSHDRGAHFSQEERTSDNLPGAVTEMRPAIALSPDGQHLFVVWQEFCSGVNDNCGRIKVAHFDASGKKIGPDVRVDAGADAAGKWNPTMTVTRAGNPLIAWVDERDAAPNGARFEHIYFARGRRNGARFTPNVRVDFGMPVPSAAALDNKWAPSIAAHGREIQVAWTDFRQYNWDIYAAHSRDGIRFSANVKVDDYPVLERIDDHPSIAVDARGTVHAAWVDRRDTDADTNIFYARSDDGGRHFSANRQIDSSATDFDVDRGTRSNRWNPRLVANGRDVLVVWQDNRLGNNDIFFVRSRDGGSTFASDERVDDTGGGVSNQYRPDLAVDETDPMGRTVYVVWEDDRQGTSDIFLASRQIP